jgi:hypothetical protein
VALRQLRIADALQRPRGLSGGGFAGSWWSAWLSRQTLVGLPRALSPSQAHDVNSERPEDADRLFARLRYSPDERVLAFRGIMSDPRARLSSTPSHNLENAIAKLYVRSNETNRQQFPDRECVEPERARRYHGGGAVTEGAIHAVRDPTHHLRLFVNYLTPRKGILSVDTWRMVTFITRNLVMLG